MMIPVYSQTPSKNPRANLFVFTVKWPSARTSSRSSSTGKRGRGSCGPSLSQKGPRKRWLMKKSQREKSEVTQKNQSKLVSKQCLRLASKLMVFLATLSLPNVKQKSQTSLTNKSILFIRHEYLKWSIKCNNVCCYIQISEDLFASCEDVSTLFTKKLLSMTTIIYMSSINFEVK